MEKPKQTPENETASAVPTAEELKQIIKKQKDDGHLKKLPGFLSLKTPEDRTKTAEWLAKNEERQRYIDDLIKKGVTTEKEEKKDRKDERPEAVITELQYIETVYDFERIIDTIFVIPESKGPLDRTAQYIAMTKQRIIDTVVYPDTTTDIKDETARIQAYLEVYEKIAADCKDGIIEVNNLNDHERDTVEQLDAWQNANMRRYKLAQICRREKSVHENTIAHALDQSDPQRGIAELELNRARFIAQNEESDRAGADKLLADLE